MKAQKSEQLTIEGLKEPVEILKDKWGISHIYADTEYDLFFAQGYNAARDRLFQFEIWRAQATGTTAEIIGPRAIKRDHGTRLFKFRGDMDQEMKHYHPRGDQIIPAYVDGVNAYIKEALKKPEDLPLPFQILGIKPKLWTPEVVISRHQGLLGNIGTELATARAVCKIGAEKVKELNYYHPEEPDLEIVDPVNCESLLENDILDLYYAYRRGIRFSPDDVMMADLRNDTENYQKMLATLIEEEERLEKDEKKDIGSNNWVVSGDLTQDGYPMMVNDPHRRQSVPSLRYWVHLNGPGWNVIGGGEPEIPGVSIGHNEYGAWGLTVFSTDGEDLYVYKTNPDNRDQYWYKGEWEEMRILEETIEVKGSDPVTVELRYTRHGPVTFHDDERNLAYAVRPAWMEVGGAPYLASLRMNQAKNWEEFREACSYSNIPGENMVWADREGNIGNQAVGIAPIRRNFSGMVPVPGDGRYEWDGYLPIKAKPHEYNPDRGYIETSNQNYTSPDYPYMDAIGYSWADPYRWARASEVLGSGRKFNMMDMIKLQHDYLSVPARTIVPLFAGLKAEDEQVEQARKLLLNWDFVLDKNSIEAGIYVAFERVLDDNLEELKIPEEAQRYIGLGMKRNIEFLLAPDEDFGPNPMSGRDDFLLNALAEGVQGLREKLGPEIEDWVYGQEDYKHALIRHPLSPAVDESTRKKLNVGPVPRGGNGNTVGSTGGGDNQTSGASFRIFVDTRNWDNTLGMNTPGQVGDPDSPLYDNLFALWANDKVFPAFFSRDKIEGVTYEHLKLQPEN
ncbi:penicillin acylase family protein [Gracilimonas halophila]|uniref:Penicillin acylase family protein n=1 Tax=Gracilimonas halophila TaxID=1834464 RepID=A0ABW5JJV0_9BACT